MLVALGVSGGIAAYKACEIVRGLTRAGLDVQVILTPNAARFITPLTLQTLSRRRVMTDPWDLSSDETIHHVDLARRIDLLAVAPATANVLAKFAHGLADDLLSTFFVAVDKPVVLAPAMNTRMWHHPATRANVATLRDRGATIVEPEVGWLAEGETGEGRLADPSRIVEVVLATARRGGSLAGKTIVVTAGPTREAIDPVRYLSNRSSGKMGFAIAAAAARRGAEVVLVSGPVDLPPPPGVRVVHVETSGQMREAVLEARAGAHAIFMVAAVSDYVPAPSRSKIKKSGGALTLVLDEGPDILAELGRTKGAEILVGFAAETDDLLRNAGDKLARKNADFIVANDVLAPGLGFGSDRNAVTILDRKGGRHPIPEAGKDAVAEAILDRTLEAEG